MRRRWWNVLLAASLCLNAGFVAAIVAHSFWPKHNEARPEEAAADPAVRAKLSANFAAFKERMAPLHKELAAERGKLMDLVESDNATPEEIKAQEERVVAVMARILDTATNHLLGQKRLLTPQESKVFFSRIRQHFQPGGADPPFHKEKHS
jgi:DNA-directed RNA polymerase sigma subunit (sigma70/sigma32)